MHPTHFTLEKAIRSNVLALPRYVTSTSDDTSARPEICLDANENSAGSCFPSQCPLSGPLALKDLHRYPSASQLALKKRIVEWRSLRDIDQICLGVGASDIIDLIIRATCTPGKHSILIAPPTFNLYSVCAGWHDVGVVQQPQLFTAEACFQLDIDRMCETLAIDRRIQVVLLASPGNPTASLIPLNHIERLLQIESFAGIVVVDEAYIDFADDQSQATALSLLSKYNNLVVVQSLSKSHGLAGIRLGMAIAHRDITENLLKIQMPYKIGRPTLELAFEALSSVGQCVAEQRLELVRSGRQQLIQDLSTDSFADAGISIAIRHPDANFVLIRVQSCDGDGPNERATRIERQLRTTYKIGVRHVGGQPLCQGCIRITVGSEEEHEALISALHQILQQESVLLSPVKAGAKMQGNGEIH